MQTSGHIQTALTAFVIAFPILVAAAFFAILWKKPYVLYSPIEYGKRTDVTSYVQAIMGARQEHRLYADIQNVIRESMRSGLTELWQAISRRTPQDRIDRILESSVGRAVERIREVGFLTIDTRPLLGRKGTVLQIPYDQFGTAQGLLDYIWSSMGTLPAFSYGQKWLLRDSETGQAFGEMGSRWAARQGFQWDSRALKESGIRPGMKLEVIRSRKAVP